MRLRRTMHAFAGAAAAFAAALGVVIATAFAAVLAVALLPAAAPAAADVDDFDYSSWTSRLEVSRDDDGHATMRVTETVVAEFPQHDQNRGIVRGIPTHYQGAPSSPRVLSVTDEAGAPVPYETEVDDGVLRIATGTDEFVHGPTTYVIEYELRDVILAASETKVDELYWDLLPLESEQDIGRFRAEIVFAPELAAELTGAAACYQGFAGSTERCELQGPQRGPDGSATFTVQSGHRAAGDGVTVAIALEPGTVVQPVARRPNPATDVVPIALGGGSAALSIGGMFAANALRRSRSRATGIVVAQYEVPDSLPPILAAQLLGRRRRALPAEIVHLAVRGALHLEDRGDKRTRPRLRRLRERTGLDPLDDRTLETLFQGGRPGTVLELPRNDPAFVKRMRKLSDEARDEAVARGLVTVERSRVAVALQCIAIPAVLAGAVLVLWGVSEGRQSVRVASFVMLAAGAFALFGARVGFSKLTLPTATGAALCEHLAGAREFIRVAEADRLRMLQSYTGAERRSDGAIDVIVLYERLLPYAMLFGMEREWGEVLAVAYEREHRRPAWSNGPTSGLGAQLVGFSGAARASAGFSSGGGGSSGGGSSGGGGGGGSSGGR